MSMDITIRLWQGNEIKYSMLKKKKKKKAFPSIIQDKNNVPENFKVVFFLQHVQGMQRFLEPTNDIMAK